MKNKRIYTSFSQIDRDLKLLKIQREIHKVCLKNDIYRLQSKLTFSQITKQVTSGIFSKMGGKWSVFLAEYLIKKMFKR